ncbi:trypsin-like peptidase domain-containing protein [Dokdonella sp.]|uniref:S1C family serine protease n=1 Tax=Dokdonella sp. TaxID=2291710 RepID=UPI0027B9C4DA|nr:trypsin-like peptidase domain-containing protein [Dokdonella sp.]
MSPSPTYRLFAFIARSVVLGLAAAFVLSVLAPRLVDRLRGGTGAVRSDVVATRAAQSYAPAVARASPAVVNIYANRITAARSAYRVFDPLSQRLLGYVAGPVIPRRDQSLGSGVIFGADGYVLTNNHVISGADDIQVMLDDGRVRRAQVVGTDVETDLAVLHIDARNLPTIAVREDAAEVGDVVLAIGNPAGVGKTVTMGIVSATGRQLRMSAFEDFIQTDAAINAGNSGGALVDASGELVGNNTAVYARPISAESNRAPQMPEGIGFAIPVATAKTVLDQIIEHGHVIRGWIGADYTDVPPGNGDAHAKGVLLVRIVPDSPAAQAGLQAGDVLLKLNGVDIVDQMDLLNRESALAPGSTARLAGLRGNQPIDVNLVMAQRPAPSTGT